MATPHNFYRGCHGDRLWRRLVGNWVVTVAVLVILVNFGTQAAVAEVGDGASFPPTGIGGSDVNSGAVHPPVEHADPLPAPVAGGMDTSAGAHQEHDKRALGGPESLLRQQRNHKQGMSDSAVLHTDQASVDETAEPMLTTSAFHQANGTDMRQRDGVCPVSLSGGPDAASSDDAAKGCTGVDVVGAEGVASPAPSQVDVASPPSTDGPPAVDESTAFTLAGGEGDSPVSLSSDAGDHKIYKARQHPPSGAVDGNPETAEALGAHSSANRGCRHDAVQEEGSSLCPRDTPELDRGEQSTAFDPDQHATPPSESVWEVGDVPRKAASEIAQPEGASPLSATEVAPLSHHEPVAKTATTEQQQASTTHAGERVMGAVSPGNVSVPGSQRQPRPGHREEEVHWSTGGGTNGGGASNEGASMGTVGGSARGEEIAVEESKAKEHPPSVEAATYAATPEASEGERLAELRADVEPPDMIKPSAVAAEAARADGRLDDVNVGNHVPVLAEGADFSPPLPRSPTASPADGADHNSNTDDVSEENISFHPYDNDSVSPTEEARQMEDPLRTSTKPATATGSSSTTLPHRYERHSLDSPYPRPSRLALSYLYYHALEALYIEENITLFVRRARDAMPYGHPRLNWLLGVLHAYGVGVPRSDRDAFVYYSFAAMEAVPEAHMALGYRYQVGLGVEANCESALAHYREVADAVAMTYDGTAAAPTGGVATVSVGAETIGSRRGGRSSSLSFFAYRDDAAASEVRKQRRLDLLKLKYQADIGKVDALLTLGYLYLKGDYQVVRDGRRAAAYFEIAAAKGNAKAQGALGQLYIAGDSSITPPLLPDVGRAFHHFRLGAALNDSVSLNGIGFLHAMGFLHQDSRYNASGREDSATGTMGIKGGVGVPPFSGPPDFETAAHYFNRSMGSEGLYNLGVLFLYGRGVPVNREIASHLFETAAMKGSVLAQWQLANMLSRVSEDGGGIPEAECKSALSLYQRTASFGTWKRRVAGRRLSDTYASIANAHAPAQSQHPGQTDVDEDSDVQLWEEMEPKQMSTDGSGGGILDGDTVDSEKASSRFEWFVRPRSESEYQVLLAGILDRLQAVEESLVASDEGEGPTTVSVTSLVELLSLAEMGDASATWLATQYVDNYLEVTETTKSNARPAVSGGAVPLFWPSSSPSAQSSKYLSGEAAASELLYYLLQRSVMHHTQTRAVLGAAYLRLGNFFYYGDSPLYGVDMERALEYYRIGGDQHGNPQALFNVGFMYQLGLHKAPRVTRLEAVMPAQVAERSEALRPYTHVPVGAEWRVHSDPPEYLRASPVLYLAVKAAANACSPASPDPTSRGVDVYLSWKYYTASLKQEARGFIPVQFFLMVLNMQWSLRHFGISTLLPESVMSMLLSVSLLPSDHSKSHLPSIGPAGLNITLPTGTEDTVHVYPAEGEVLMGRWQVLAESLRVVCTQLMTKVMHVAEGMLSWYLPLEDAVLYGSVSVIVAGLLVRHHVA